MKAAGIANWDEFVRIGGWDVGVRPPTALGVRDLLADRAVQVWVAEAERGVVAFVAAVPRRLRHHPQGVMPAASP